MTVSNFMSHIFLYGPPGTGKSTIGKKLARNLKVPFVDLDRVIETKAGMSIAQIMEQQGESVFRDIETAVLKETVGHASSVTDASGKVIALGGGALQQASVDGLDRRAGRDPELLAELDPPPLVGA